MYRMSGENYFNYPYAPILALSPSEMMAVEQLPEKDKDLILPIIPLKGWAVSKHLDKSIERIKKSIGNRRWVASIDTDAIFNNKIFQLTGKFPREVFYELVDLLSPESGYINWYNFVKEIPEAIPSILLTNMEDFDTQVERLCSLGRGIVAYFSTQDIELRNDIKVLRGLRKLNAQNVYVVYDFGAIDHGHIGYRNIFLDFIKFANSNLPDAPISISATSFPMGFSGRNYGECTIYERMLYNKLFQELQNINLIYSDYGSTRAEIQNGGSGSPAPRIDYPLKNEWQFIRKECKDPKNPQDGERQELYRLIAKEIISKDYWIPELHLWGTQMIERTAENDSFGINSPQKATAVRINIHLYNQLHYHSTIAELDTDEDWVD